MTVLVSFEDKKEAVAEWIELLSGVPLNNIRGADETGKFSYPACVIAEISEIDTHRPFRRVEEIDGVLQFVVYASRRVMLDINFITRTRGDYTKEPAEKEPAERVPDAGHYMSQFHSSLYLPEKSIEFLSKNDLSILSAGSPLRADEKKNDGWQRRRVIEIGLGYISQTTEQISTIESIQNIKGTTYILDEKIELEINLGPYQSTDEKGQPNGYASLDSDGTVPVDELPDRVKVCVFNEADEVSQLALPVQEGDICVRSDENKTYVALNEDNLSMSDWQENLAAPQASVISEDALHRFVTDAEKTSWNNKQADLGFTPEDSANKGAANGYAALDATTKVPLVQLPDHDHTDLVHLAGAEDITGIKDHLNGLKIASSPVVSSISQGAADNDKAVTKGHMDDAIAAALTAAIILQGDWNANTNTPDITTTTTAGHAWRVSVAGNTDLGGITDWEINDLAVKTATGWMKFDNEDVAAVWGNIAGTLSNQTDLQNALNAKENSLGFTPEDSADKGAANGYAELDATTKVPAAQIPDLSATYEPVFSKNTAFNKDLGAAAGDVAEGDKVALLAGRSGGQYLISETATVTEASTGTRNPTLAERNSTFEFTQTGAAASFVIQTDATLNFPIGSRFPLRKNNAEIVNITKVGGVAFRGVLGNNPAVLSGQDGYYAYLEKVAANTWLLTGAIQAP